MDAFPATRAARRRPRAAFAMREGLPERLFGADGLRRLGELLELDPVRVIDDFDAVAPEELAGIEVLVTGWDCPPIGAEVLERMPSLSAVLHAAGTVKGHLGPEAWERGILVTSAAAANAVPVAEYTLAMILLAGKGVPGILAEYRRRPELDVGAEYPGIGNYRRRVGVLGASKIGRRVIELLQPFDLDVAVSDPYLRDDDPVLRGARRVGLEELFREHDVVSVHAPLLPETIGLVDRGLIASMRPGAVLINTARAPIVDQEALVEAAAAGRITAVLDVTDPEPLPADHPLRRVPGVIATPHVAGALGNELRRLGEAVLDEVERFVEGAPPAHPVAIADLAAMA